MSTLSLAKNGYVSSSKRTKHIKAKYFFIRHYHHAGDVTLQYCPTEQMWADVLTKPLQGAKFCLMRAFLMNCPMDYTDLPEPVPSSTTRLQKPLSSPFSSSRPTFVSSDVPTETPMKARSLQSTPSPQGCVETPSHSTYAPGVTWRDKLFPPPHTPLPITTDTRSA